MRLRLPRNKNNTIMMASVELNDETRKILKDVGLKPHALAGRVIYYNGSIAVIDKGITAPKTIPTFSIYELPEVEFVDGDVCMDAIGELGIKERFPVAEACGVVVTYALGDRCLTFTPPVEGVAFEVPRTEIEFDRAVEKLADLGHPYDLRYQMLTYQPAKRISSVVVEVDESWRVVMFMVNQAALELTGCHIRTIDESEGFIIGENEFVFEIHGHTFLCNIPKALLSVQTNLFGMASEDVVGHLRETIVSKTHQLMDGFCKVLDVNDPKMLVELLKSHI